MKKRKSPIFLVTILIVLVVVIAAWNYRPSSGDSQGPKQSDDVKTGPSRTDTPSVTDLATKAKQGLKGSPTAPAPMNRARMGMPPDAMPPSIENPAAKAGHFKPTPNDSSTSMQWYSDEARK